jgi:hypothetical protein
MHPFFAALRGGHGHSHGSEGTCPSHSHGGHNHLEMSEDVRKIMLKRLEEQMMMMRAAEGNLTKPGRVFYDPNDPGPGPYNKLVFGYGHEGVPPPQGWGSLAPSLPQETGNEPVMPLSSDDMNMFMMHMGPTERDRYWSPTLPFVGRLRIVRDRPGLLQALGVVLYWLYGNWSTWTAILLPYYADGAISLPLILSKLARIIYLIYARMFSMAVVTKSAKRSLCFWFVLISSSFFSVHSSHPLYHTS